MVSKGGGQQGRWSAREVVSKGGGQQGRWSAREVVSKGVIVSEGIDALPFSLDLARAERRQNVSSFRQSR